MDMHAPPVQHLRDRLYRSVQAMNNEGRGNPEYLAVLSEVVTCLFRQLHHPMLTMDARQITDWFHHVRLEDVQEILDKEEAKQTSR